MLKFIFSLLLGLACTDAFAQQSENVPKTDEGFIPGEKIIFEDNFNASTATDGHMQRWFTWPCKGKFGYLDRQGFQIQEADQIYTLQIKPAGDQPVLISPLVSGIRYLGDVFTVDYNFTLNTPGSSTAMCFEFSKKWGNCLLQSFEITNDGNNGLLLTYHNPDSMDAHGKVRDLVKKIPCGAIYHTWRHFGLFYKDHMVKCFIDTLNVLTLSNCEFTPLAYYQQFRGSVDIRNVVIAKGEGKINIFNRLYTERKFTTHAILFDVNKSTIKQESMPFISQLADWLRKNPNVNLEVDGHTDSDGDAATNLRLSQERADEVKKQLISMGVYMKRLTAKGYGETQPIQPNTTPEGKANNRRVEFIKL